MKTQETTKDRITEGNRLIAEFMGHKVDFGFKKDGVLLMPAGVGNANNNAAHVSLNFLQYHASWNWLMPVVAKIVQNIEYIEQENREYLMDIVPYGRIEDTLEAVVKFIEWYNQQKA